MANLQFLKNLHITTKFILWFLFISLLPLTIAIYVSYNSSQKALEEEVANSLRALADNKAYQIEVYLREKEKNVTTLSHMSDIIEAMEKFKQAFKGNSDSETYATVEQEYRPFLSYYQRSFGYDDLFLIQPNGEIIFSVSERKGPSSLYEIALYKDSELAQAFINAKKSLKTEISNFEYSPQTKKAAVFIAAPVFKGANLIGVVALQMSNQGISRLVQDYTGLAQTGETIVASKLGKKIVFITPLRFDPDAAFNRKINIGTQSGLDIQKAVQGGQGIGMFVDYRGKKVMSVWRYLPSFRLGMVVKMDIKEIFASANKLRNTLLIISLGLLMMVVVMAVLIARSVSSPIKELTEISATIAGGNLSARAKIDTKDEIGELARSFNQMTDSLVEAKANVEQKKAELEEQKKLLEKANQELDSFVYTASHDLRAPLRAISSFSSFLEEDYYDKFDKEGRDYLKEIREGAQRMDQLIEDLLSLSRISRIKNPYEEVNMNSLIRSVIKRIEFDIKKHKVVLNIQENMPTVKCDRIKISEVFLNLINNAIKFSSKNNKENPKVDIGYVPEDNFHKFYVKDNGIGIDPKYHQQIFGIFKRLHTTEEYEGTGAGLSIVKRVIDDHGGKIWIESEQGKGATFYFTIPKQTKEKAKKISEILVAEGHISKDELAQTLKKQSTG
jgi:signal transduction histidine kinase